MKLKLKEKSEKELEKMLKDLKEDLHKSNFSISGSGAKNVRQIREIRRNIARVMTELNSK